LIYIYSKIDNVIDLVSESSNEKQIKIINNVEKNIQVLADENMIFSLPLA